MPSAAKTLSVTEKLGYGLGDFAANFVFQTQITFLMYFYTDVFGITAGAAGTLLLVSRLCDAIYDPIIGAIADRTSSRWGRFRPWLLWTAVPLAIALVLCYTTPHFDGTGKIVWAYATYNLLMLIYAANNIPYCALSGVMTDDPIERTSLASWRFFCAMMAALVVNLFTLDLVKYFGQGNAARGYQFTMGLWAVIAVAFFGVTFASTKERVVPNPRQRTTVRQDLLDLFRNGPWIARFVLSVLIYIQLAIRSSTMPYYFTYFVRREDLFGRFSGVGLTFTIIGVLCSKPLAACFGKRTTFRMCLLLSAVLMALFALVPRESLALMFLLQVFLQLAFGPTIPILWAMMADVADYSEWKTGRRATALAFASVVFGLKLGLAIGGWLSGKLFNYFGYAAATDLPASATRGIVLMISVFPAAALLLGLGVLFGYHIDKPTERLIENSLRERRNRIHSATSTKN